MLLLLACAVAGKIGLPEQIGDHMVLQQMKQVRLWGECDEGAVEITFRPSWTSESFSTKASSKGHWDTYITTPSASLTEHNITISTKKTKFTLMDVLIGEVFIASGQSNMEMPLDGLPNCPISGSNLAIAQCAKYTAIRFAIQPKKPTTVPIEYVPGKWQKPDPDTCPHWSAVAFFFAVTLYETMNIPIGVLVSAWGGSRVESWMPREVLVEVGENLSVQWKDYAKPMQAFYSQLWPIRRYTIRAIIWYQGECNVYAPDAYAGRLARMVAHWRLVMEQGPRPFYQVELPPFLYGGALMSGALLREAQQNAQRMIPHSGIVGTNDVVKPYEYTQCHLSNKKTIGERLALFVLHQLMGYTATNPYCPQFKGFSIHKRHVHVSFSNAQDGLSPWSGILGFEVANETGEFQPAEAVKGEGHSGDWIIDVWSTQVEKPVAVRYCFHDFLMGNLMSTRGLPVMPFRSDDWHVPMGVLDELDWEEMMQKGGPSEL
jgi:sialate O-acetylesterase